METNEYYRKVFIKTEADLPKESGKYWFHAKTQLSCFSEVLSLDFFDVNDERHKTCGTVFDWYLLPYTPKEISDEEIIQLLKQETEIAFARGMDATEINGKCYEDIYNDMYFDYVMSEIIPQIKAMRDGQLLPAESKEHSDEECEHCDKPIPCNLECEQPIAGKSAEETLRGYDQFNDDHFGISIPKLQVIEAMEEYSISQLREELIKFAEWNYGCDASKDDIFNGLPTNAQIVDEYLQSKQDK